MAIQRFRALEEVLSRTPVQVTLPKATVSEFYGENVFNKETMKKWLSDEAYKSVLAAMEQSTKLAGMFGFLTSGEFNGATHKTLSIRAAKLKGQTETQTSIIRPD